MTDPAPMLERVIMQIESSGFAGAVKIEDHLRDNPPPWVSGATPAIAHINHCDSPTALWIASTSWGLFQILGAVLYGDLAFPAPLASFWIDSEQQITQFRALVKRWGFDPINFDFSDMGLIARFAARYNGPDNVADYSSKMVGTYMLIRQQDEANAAPA